MGPNDLESTINLCKKELKSDDKIGLNSRRSWRLEIRKKIQDKKKFEEIER